MQGGDSHCAMTAQRGPNTSKINQNLQNLWTTKPVSLYDPSSQMRRTDTYDFEQEKDHKSQSKYTQRMPED